MTVRICFVCLGNICRSPTAEATMRRLLEREGLTKLVQVDSAGTCGWHVGAAPDRRAVGAAKRRGIQVSSSARQVTVGDFVRFDYLIAMDCENRDALLRMAPDDVARDKVTLFRAYDSRSPSDAEVPDPYYGGDQGFERVLDICEAASRGLLQYLQDKHRL